MDEGRFEETVRKAVASVAMPVYEVPTLGGSVPMRQLSQDLRVPVIGVPIANYDNNQHAADENIRIGHFLRGIEIYAALLTVDWRSPSNRDSSLVWTGCVLKNFGNSLNLSLLP